MLVICPWWLCKEALFADYRAWVRWERAETRALMAVWPDDKSVEGAFEEYNRVYEEFRKTRPPFPRCLQDKEGF